MTCPVCGYVTSSREPLYCSGCGYAYPAAKQRPARLEYAGFVDRAKALAIDYGVTSLVVGPLALYLFPPHPIEREILARGPLSGPDMFLSMMLFYRLIAIMGMTMTVMFVYQAAMTASSIQGSVGKLVMRLKVVDLMGRPLTFQRAAWREVCRVASILPGHLGFFWVAIDRKKQGFHDKIAGTLVVRAREQERSHRTGA